MITFILNEQQIQTDLPSGTTVLDFVRYQQHLCGTKIGCREGDCGACTLLVGQLKEGQLHYHSVTSCLMPLGNAHGKHILTIEGINQDRLSPVQQAIIEEGGTQCGFCTVGFAMSLTGFALQATPPSYPAAVAAIDGNICRCTGYKSLQRAAASISQQLSQKDSAQPLQWLIKQGFLPAYIAEIEGRLQQLQAQHAPISTTTKSKEIIGGGTDLLVQRPEEIAEASLQHYFDHPELQAIRQEGQQCIIGAAATAEDIRSNPLMQSLFPRLHDFMKLVSSTPIRNMGTVGGNLVNASPIGDLTIFFLALNSQLRLRKGDQLRSIALKDFYKGYKTLDLQEGEHLEQLSFELPSPTSHFNFEKVCKRTHLDIASVNAACSISLEGELIADIHLSAGGLAPIPKYLSATAKAMKGKPLNSQTLAAAAAVMQEEVSPISDARGSASYKRLLLRQLFYAHFIACFPQHISMHALTQSS